MTILIFLISLVICFYIIKKHKIKKSFNRKDEDFSNETKVSWSYVENSFSSTIEEIKRKKCPKCELESPNLEWFIFCSSRDSWMQLSGSAGLYSKCPNCEIIVDQIITVVS